MTGTTPWDSLGEAKSATREPRAVSSRENSMRSTTWSPPSILPDPTPRDGWVHKWIRAETRSTPDKVTYAKRLREGWEPCVPSDYPEITGVLKGTVADNGLIETGGLILCRMPEEMVAQRRAYYAGQAAAQLDSAEQSYLRDSDERMKKVMEKKRQTVFGR